MPRATYFELGTWATINFVYTQRTSARWRSLSRIRANRRKPSGCFTRSANGWAIASRSAWKTRRSRSAKKRARRSRLDFSSAALAAETSQGAFDHAIAEKTHKLRDDRGALHCGCGRGSRSDPDGVPHRRLKPRSAVRAALCRRRTGRADDERFGSSVGGLRPHARKRTQISLTPTQTVERNLRQTACCIPRPSKGDRISRIDL